MSLPHPARPVPLAALLLRSLPGAAQPGLLQHAAARRVLSLNGNWHYLVGPYENGFYDYRRQAFDQSAAGRGGYYDNQQPSTAQEPELLEYNFDRAATMQVPGNWNSPNPRLLHYEGTIWHQRNFTLRPRPGRRYFLYFGAITYEAHVYLNGRKLGVHRPTFRLAARKGLIFSDGQKNRLSTCCKPTTAGRRATTMCPEPDDPRPGAPAGTLAAPALLQS